MGMFNTLIANLRCPRCEGSAWMEADFRFGALNLDEYRLGDSLRWAIDGGGLRRPAERPAGGNYVGEGYVECPVCGKDFWVTITVESDIIEEVSINQDKSAYIR